MRQSVMAAFVGGLALALAGAAFAEPPASGDSPASAKPAKPKKGSPDEIVCKTTEQIGTRLGGGRICKTRADWNAGTRDAADQVNDTQRNILLANPKGN